MKKHLLTFFLFTLSFTLSILYLEIRLENFPCASLTLTNRCIAEAATEEEIAAKTAKIETLFNHWIDKEAPGAAVWAIYQGELIECNGYGVKDLEQKEPITSTTKFRLASLSKPIFASAILLLQQQGKLSLDDPIIKYLPELNCSEAMTIRHLLTHTSGLYRMESFVEDTLDALSEYKTLDNNDVVEILGELNLSALSPGEEYGYSNIGYECLPVIISRAAGMDFKEYMTKELFTPMMLQNTGFDGETLETQGHSEDITGELKPAEADPFDSLYGGGIYSTIEDLALFDQVLYTNFLHPQELLNEAFTPFTLKNGEVTEQGLGWGVYTDPKRGKCIWHDGSWNGYAATMYRFPEELSTVIILCNRDDIDPNTLAQEILILCDETKPATSSTEETPPDEETPSDLEPLTGTHDPSTDTSTGPIEPDASSDTSDVSGNNGMGNLFLFPIMGSGTGTGGLGNLLGGFLGGGTGGIENLLGEFMGRTGSTSGTGSGGMDNMLGGLLGGNSGTANTNGTGGIGSLFGGFMGGGIGNLFGGLLGGGTGGSLTPSFGWNGRTFGVHLTPSGGSTGNNTTNSTSNLLGGLMGGGGGAGGIGSLFGGFMGGSASATTTEPETASENTSDSANTASSVEETSTEDTTTEDNDGQTVQEVLVYDTELEVIETLQETPSYSNPLSDNSSEDEIIDFKTMLGISGNSTISSAQATSSPKVKINRTGSLFPALPGIRLNDKVAIHTWGNMQGNLLAIKTFNANNDSFIKRGTPRGMAPVNVCFPDTAENRTLNDRLAEYYNITE